jgi:hypothetical protein
MQTLTLSRARSFRAFGTQAGDIQVDFAAAPPVVAMGVIRCCLSDPPEVTPEALLALPVSEQIACLLRIVAAGDDERLQLAQPCAACGERMGIELVIPDLITFHLAALAADTLAVDLDGAPLTLRRPTGQDQIAWLAERQAGISVQQVLATLLVAGALPDEGLRQDDLERLSAAMDDFDPLVNFRVETACPYCGASGSYALDLQAEAMQRLRLIQQDLIHQVHVVAWHYHWDEAAILAMPAHRRQQYLRLIEREVEARWATSHS